jgi:L-histidine Nalpha-methyltransferase
MPAALEAELERGLRRGEINPKFLYASARQTDRWLELHQQHAPKIALSFPELPQGLMPQCVVGLSCGPAFKERSLLKRLGAGGTEFVAVDVSNELLLKAHESCRDEGRRARLAVADTSGWLSLRGRFQLPPKTLFTFFGTIHNFVPSRIFGLLSELIAPEDALVVSANLAPGGDYGASMRKLLGQYDNEATTKWLEAFLEEWGIPGRAEMRIEDCPGGSGLSRFAGYVRMPRNCAVKVGEAEVKLLDGYILRLFYSYRYTAEIFREMATNVGFATEWEWINESGEEGWFLLKK